MKRTRPLLVACALWLAPALLADPPPPSPAAPNFVSTPATPPAASPTATAPTHGAPSRKPASAKPKAKSKPAKRKPNEAVNLDDLDAPEPPRPDKIYDTLKRPDTGSSSGVKFKAYLDIALTVQPGITPFSFNNFHTVLMVDFLPSSELQFAMGIAPPSAVPRFFELDYRVAERLQVRLGRIWIPFDMMSPHNTFGGFINTSRMRAANQENFLPDVWADLGVGAKYTFIERPDLKLDGDLYVVNGLREGGLDPRGETTSYPNFLEASTDPDNNVDKAFGARVHALINQVWGVGGSFYTGRWTNDANPAGRITMLGLDAQCRAVKRWEFRFGYAFMSVGLPSATTRTSYVRGGLYTEATYRLLDNINTGVRFGVTQNDSGVSDPNDRTNLGVKVDYLFSPILQFSFQYYHDLRFEPGKLNRDTLMARAAIVI